MKKLLISIFLIYHFTTHAQQIQWADKVVNYSSTFKYDKYPEQYHPDQVLGRPSTIGDNKAGSCVWVAEKQDKGYEFITVCFAEKQEITQVFINEDFNPGSITKVFIYPKLDKDGNVNEKKRIQVYSNSNPAPTNNPGQFRVFLKEPTEGVAVRVELNTAAVKGYNSIDAIGISDSDDPLEVKINLTETINHHQPERLSNYINDENRQLNAVISPTGNRLYFTYEYVDKEMNDSIKQKIHVSELDPNGVFSAGNAIGKPLNMPGTNNALLSITPDGQTALILNVYDSVKGKTFEGVSISHRSRKGWGFPEKQYIDDFDNLNDFGEYHLSNDQNVLLMAVQLEDTYGAKDLYVSFRKSTPNHWTKPLNLGAVVNTASSEVRPFLAADGVTIYYATSGLPGFGGSDLYMTKRLDDTWRNWSEPKNMGQPINGPGFDAYYTIPASGEYAYFSKDDPDLDTKSDIYRIKLRDDDKPEAVQVISGTVRDAKTLKELETTIYYHNLETGDVVGVAHSDPHTGAFTIVLPKGLAYSFHAEKQHYYAIRENIDLTNLETYREIQQDLLMEPVEVNKPIRLNNVFFYRGMAKLLPNSYPELQSVVKMLEESETMEIKIEGHTDSYGNAEANLKLSWDRADAIKEYLVENGIKKKRITTEGFGGAIPIADNDDPAERPKNRRVEFRIMKN